jgi:predicted house-cleaning noncanonical NTP pyrophosphatase (MazG superfamily)
MVSSNQELKDDLIFHLNEHLKEFLERKTSEELADFTLANYKILDHYLSDSNKKMLLDKMLNKFRVRKYSLDTDKIAKILKLPMVSSNKELKAELTHYLDEWEKARAEWKRLRS